jgi:hypothetical protein
MVLFPSLEKYRRTGAWFQAPGTSYAGLTRASIRIAKSVLRSMDRGVKLDDSGRLAGFRRDLSAMCIEP